MSEYDFGLRLKELRQRIQRTQDDVAKSLGISRAAYSHLENNRNEPDNEMLSKLADYYDVTTDYLLGRKVDLGDVPVAAHLRNGLSLDDLPADRRKEVEEYIEYQKARYKKDLEDGRIKKD